MQTYCVREKKKTNNKPGTENLIKTKNNRWRLVSICASCGAKKSQFVKKKSGSGVFGPRQDNTEDLNNIYRQNYFFDVPGRDINHDYLN